MIKFLLYKTILTKILQFKMRYHQRKEIKMIYKAGNY
jgi:hypothetical protein